MSVSFSCVRLVYIMFDGKRFGARFLFPRSFIGNNANKMVFFFL